MTGEGQEAHRAIAVLGGKGGVGCSFLALNLAALAARSNRLTALVDAVPRRQQLALMLDLPAVDAVPEVIPRHDLLAMLQPGPDRMHVLVGATATAETIRDHLRVLFDFVIVDAGSGADLSLAQAADDVVVVTAATRQSLQEASRRVEALEASGVRCLCVLNRTEPGGTIDTESAATTLRHTVDATLPYDPALVSASLHAATPLVDMHQDCHAAHRIRRLAAMLGLTADQGGDVVDEPSVHVTGRRLTALRRLGIGRRAG